MSKNLSKLKIPKLRFSGFSGEWSDNKLMSFSRIYDGTHQTPTYVKEGVPFYSVEHLTANDFSKTKFVAKSVFDKENQKVKIEKNDILMTRIGDIGTARYIDWDVNASFYVSLALIKPSKEIDSLFLSKYISSVNFQKELWKRTIHVAFPKKINLGEIGECKLSLPSIKEQQKIAESLESTDKWIENLKEQKESFELYKKGMVQRLFSQEIRFKDDKGKDFPKWEEKKLSEISKSYNGLVGKAGDDFGIGKPFITYKQIFDSSEIDVRKFALVKVENGEKQNTASFGDVFFTVSSETPNEVGFSSVLFDKTLTPYLNSFSFGLRFNSLKEYDPSFAKFFFRSFVFRKEVVKLAQGSTRYNISKVEFMRMNFLFPSFSEQCKIADFLTSVDKVIQSKQQQITQAELWKKGLMQDLFV